MPGACVQPVHKTRRVNPCYVCRGPVPSPCTCRHVSCHPAGRRPLDHILRDLEGADPEVVSHPTVRREIAPSTRSGVVGIARIAHLVEIDPEGMVVASEVVGTRCRRGKSSEDSQHRDRASEKGFCFHGVLFFPATV